MESVQQHISNCLKGTVGKYYTFEEEELIEGVDKLYNILSNDKIHENTTVRTDYTITTLNAMKKDNINNYVLNIESKQVI